MGELAKSQRAQILIDLTVFLFSLVAYSSTVCSALVFCFVLAGSIVPHLTKVGTHTKSAESMYVVCILFFNHNLSVATRSQ